MVLRLRRVRYERQGLLRRQLERLVIDLLPNRPVNSLRIVLAAQESIDTGRAVEL